MPSAFARVSRPSGACIYLGGYLTETTPGRFSPCSFKVTVAVLGCQSPDHTPHACCGPSGCGARSFRCVPASLVKRASGVAKNTTMCTRLGLGPGRCQGSWPRWCSMCLFLWTLGSYIRPKAYKSCLWVHHHEQHEGMGLSVQFSADTVWLPRNLQTSQWLAVSAASDQEDRAPPEVRRCTHRMGKGASCPFVCEV